MHQFNITHANVKLLMQTSLGRSSEVAVSPVRPAGGHQPWSDAVTSASTLCLQQVALLSQRSRAMLRVC